MRTLAKLLSEEGVAASLAVEIDAVADETQSDASGRHRPRCRLRQHDVTAKLSKFALQIHRKKTCTTQFHACSNNDKHAIEMLTVCLSSQQIYALP